MPARTDTLAADSVLCRPELLELILCHVDITTLLVSAQRVSRWWHDVISSSPALQRLLFFRPCLGECIEAQERDSGQGPPSILLNPLLAAKFGRFFFDPHGVGIRQTAMSFYASLPLAAVRPPPPPKDAREKRKTVEEVRRASLHRFTRAEASWRRMLVSQPPPPPALGYVKFEDNLYAPDIRVLQPLLVSPDSQSAEGLRMGQLYDLVQSEAAGERATSRRFRLLWSPNRSQMFGVGTGVFRELISRAHVVLEVRYMSYDVCSPDPQNLALLNAMFRCEGSHRRPPLSVEILS